MIEAPMSWIHEWILLLILLAMMSGLLWLLHRTRLGVRVRQQIADRSRRRLFVASVSFFVTFATVRGMVLAIRHNIPPFQYVYVEGRHIHHLVFGILTLLLVGYGWLCEVGSGSDSSSILASRVMALLYGLGAALTLDEFALLGQVERCLLRARRTIQHRRRYPVWLVARHHYMGRPAFRCQ
jgi:hypothetical protein